MHHCRKVFAVMQHLFAATQQNGKNAVFDPLKWVSRDIFVIWEIKNHL
jgi:hypothetical protein